MACFLLLEKVKIKMKKFLHKWVKTFSRTHTIQRISFLWPYFMTGLPQDRKIRASGLMAIKSGKKYDYYMYEDEWMNCLERFAKHLMSPISKQEKELQNLAHSYGKVAKEVKNADLGRWSNKRLSAWFRRYSLIYSHYSFYALSPWAIDYVLAPRLISELKQLNRAKSGFWIEVISTPTRLNTMTQQQIDLLKIASTGKLSKLKGHVKKYYWLPIYNLSDKPWKEQDFEKQMKSIKNPQKELQDKQKEFKRRKERYEKTLKEINPSKELRRVIEAVHLYTYLRDQRVDIWRKIIDYIEPFYAELAKRANIRLEDSINFFDEEILRFLEEGTLPVGIKERKRQHAIIYIEGIRKIFTKTKEINKLKERELGNMQKSTELNGLIAYKGVAKGKVRIISTPKDLPSLKEGEILVAHHTSPDYVIAMRKSAAIVTDEGGITSHAAIVSRELKIPCITNTKIGSQILKTGDFIRVDANKGIVKILKKAA